MKKLISYARVSTVRQGRSGLGLAAQQNILNGYAESVGGSFAAAYVEIESGTQDDRPELAKALSHAKKIKARLVFAKLDRLGRSVAFISKLIASGVDIVDASSPNDDTFVMHIRASMAQEEAKKISERTKAALAVAKSRGTLLGSSRVGHWDGHEAARLAGGAKGAESMKRFYAKETSVLYADVRKFVNDLPDMSLQKIANKLNEAGMTTLRGQSWSATQVSRVLKSA